MTDIIVKIGGVEYATYLDERGTQRFYENSNNPLILSSPKQKNGEPDFNQMSILYRQGKFSQREYAEFNMAVGYSVYGFSELSSFEDMLIENPLWDNGLGKTYQFYTNNYLLANMRKSKMSLKEALKILAERDGLTEEEADAYFVKKFLSDM